MKTTIQKAQVQRVATKSVQRSTVRAGAELKKPEPSSQTTNGKVVKRVPPPRLVNVELNPGPPKKEAKNQKKKGKKAKTVVKVVIKQKHQTMMVPHPHPTKHTVERPMALSGSALYLATLNDPWQYGPVSLGWGCMTQTSLAFAYFRNTINVSSGNTCLVLVASAYIGTGSPYGFLAQKQCASPGDTTTAFTFNSATNWSQLTGNYTAARLVSLGMRAQPCIKATDAPGIQTGGLYVSGTGIPPTQTTLNYSTFSSLPQSVLATTVNGSTALWKPTDPSDFDFSTQLMTASPTTSTSPNGYPFIAISGLPSTGCSVLVDVVANYECLSGGLSNTGASEEQFVVGREAPNPETWFSKFGDKLASDWMPTADKVLQYGPHVAKFAQKFMQGYHEDLVKGAYSQITQQNAEKAGDVHTGPGYPFSPSNPSGYSYNPYASHPGGVGSLPPSSQAPGPSVMDAPGGSPTPASTPLLQPAPAGYLLVKSPK